MWLLCRLVSGELGPCDAAVSIIEERQPPSPWLLCGSEEALPGWERLMKSTGESVRASTSQRRNSSCSPCTCSEAPLLSCSGWRSLNDLQISVIFQGPTPFRVLPGRMMVVVVVPTVFPVLLCLIIFPLTATEARVRFNCWSTLQWRRRRDPSHSPERHHPSVLLCPHQVLTVLRTGPTYTSCPSTRGKKDSLRWNAMAQAAAGPLSSSFRHAWLPFRFIVRKAKSQIRQNVYELHNVSEPITEHLQTETETNTCRQSNTCNYSSADD